jgi:Family of unknown function (DUF6312)
VRKFSSLKDVTSVVVLKPNGSGFDAVEVYNGEDVSRSTSRRLRPIEKIIVRTMRAQAKATTAYLDRHVKSSAKKKNGWFKDLGKNMSKSVRQESKKLFKIKIF